MAQGSRFRIRNTDRSEFTRLSRNANAKLSRIQQNYGIRPSDIHVPNSIESFSSRADFNEWVDKIERFTRRGNPNYMYRQNKYGVVASVAEINQADRRNRLAQSKAEMRMREIWNKPVIVDGEVSGTVGERQRMRMNEMENVADRIKDYDFDSFRTRELFDKKNVNMQNKLEPDYYDERDERLKQNFIRAVQGSTTENTDEIIDKLNRINGRDLYELFQTNPDIITFEEFDSDGVIETREGVLEELNRTLDRYLNNELDLWGRYTP